MRLTRAMDRGLRRPPRPPAPTKLWVSDIGRCPRAVMFRCLGTYEVTHPFDVGLLDVMQLGQHLENASAELLARDVGAENIERDVRVGNHLWSGRIDFLLRTPDGAIIVEHKATGANWWDYNAELPKLHHMAQALLYQKLMAESCGETLTTRLLYRAWHKRAEFEVSDEGQYMLALGYVDGHDGGVSRRRNFNLTTERHTLEHLYQGKELPDKPWYDPTIPDAACCFKGDPSCLYYGHCWEYHETAS